MINTRLVEKLEAMLDAAKKGRIVGMISVTFGLDDNDFFIERADADRHELAILCVQLTSTVETLVDSERVKRPNG